MKQFNISILIRNGRKNHNTLFISYSIIGDYMKKSVFFLCFLLCMMSVHAVDFQGKSYIVMESTLKMY